MKDFLIKILKPLAERPYLYTFLLVLLLAAAVRLTVVYLDSGAELPMIKTEEKAIK